jgi:hypothetical protein
MIEPRDDPARYDQEFFLALHDWDGYLLANEDGAMNPSYAVATINGKAMGFGRAAAGQAGAAHLCCTCSTRAPPRSTGLRSPAILSRGGARRQPGADPAHDTHAAARARGARQRVVEMNNPGVWVLGEVRRHVQALGMAVAVEYENRRAPRAGSSRRSHLELRAIRGRAARRRSSEPPILVPLVFESKFRGHGAMEAWTINGNPIPMPRVAPLIRAGAIACSSSTRAWMTIRCICTAIVSSCAASGCLSRRPRGAAPKDIGGHHEGRRAGRRADPCGSRVHGRQSRRQRCFTVISRTIWTLAS